MINSRHQYNQGYGNKVNLIPLIDIFAVLLIVFMIAMPSLLSRISITLPNVNEQKQENVIQNVSDTALIFTINANGEYFLNDNKIKKNEIRYILNKKDKTKQIYILGDKDTKYQHISSLLATIEYFGYRNINLVTQE